MSRSSSYNIASQYFMIDPVPPKMSENNDHSKTSNKIFFKGGQETGPSFEHIGGAEDVFLVKNNETSFQLHLSVLKETLHELKGQSTVQIKDLDSVHTESFKGIVEALKLLYTVPPLYELVMGNIKNVFEDISRVKPGSVGAFFVGCFQDDTFPGPLGCSPKCVASLPPSDDGTLNTNSCEDLVLIYEGGFFNSLNDKRSSHAYIYIDDSDFSGFSVANIQQLKEANIESATIIYGNPDGTYREILNPMSIHQLLLQPENITITSSNINTKQNNTTTVTTTSNTSAAAVAFIIIILIIIVLLSIFLYQMYWK